MADRFLVSSVWPLNPTQVNYSKIFASAMLDPSIRNTPNRRMRHPLFCGIATILYFGVVAFLINAATTAAIIRKPNKLEP